MANPFDQFDQAPTPQAAPTAHAAGNPFDQFDGTHPAPTPNVPASQHVDAQGNHPNMLEAGIMDLTNSAPWKDMTGAFQSASANGFGGFVARHLLADQGPVGNITRGLAGVHGTPTQDQINQAVLQTRQQAAQQQHENAQNVNVFGHQIDPLATASGLVGGVDPTLAIPVPGLGGIAGKIATRGLAGAAARIGVNAAGHAAFGSASDAVYQGADMLDGLQKDFDVQRNLHAAVAMGALGGTFGAVHEASPFVQSLFKTRNGIDTTPAADPRGTTNPLSGADGMTPAQLQEYHSVLQSGNEQDIHNYFNDKNIEPPAHADIHEWVNRRDNMQVQTPETPEQLTQKMLGTPDLRPAVQDHIAQQTASWKNAPEYEVINHTDDIQDPAVRAAAVREGADNPDALGFVGSDNKVRIFANRIDSPETLNAVLYHESLGHYGLQQQFGARLDAMISNLMDRNVGKFGRDVDAWQQANPGAYGGDRIRAGEEVLANMSNDGTLKPSLADAVTSHVRNFGRKMGMKLSYSDGEVRQILNMAHQAVISGKTVRLNGFATKSRNYQPLDMGANAEAAPQPTKFMFTGPKAAGFNPHDPTSFVGSDGMPRNEIDDYTSHLHDMPEQFHGKLGDVLHHPDLYEQYPHLKDVNFQHSDLRDVGLDAGYDPTTKTIHLSNHLTDHTERLNATLHETQHAIQDHEGLMDGVTGNAKASDEQYSADPLEHEARATEQRVNMTPDQRAQNAVLFMRRSDLAASKDYVSKDLEGIYKSLDRDYKPDTRSWDEVRRSALEAGFAPSQIKDLSDVGDLSTKLWRLQSAANMADQKIAMLNEKLGGPNWTVDDRANYLTTLADRHYLVQRIKGNRSEIGRALNVSKAASSYSNATMEAVAARLREEGSGLADLADNEVKFMKFAQEVKTLMESGNKAGARVKISGVTKPYWEQYLNSFHFNAMLSALSTHVKAPIDMGTGIIRDVFEKTLAMPIGAVRVGVGKALGKTDIEPGVSANELAMHTYGMAKAFMDMEVYKQMATAIKTGDGGYVDPAGNFQPVNMMNQYGAVSNPNIGPVLGLPSHMVAAQDLFFRSQGMNANMYSYAVRKAKEQLGPGASFDDINTLASALAHEPSQAMLDYAKDRTNRTLLLNNNPLNNFLTKMRTYGPNMTVGQRVAAFTVNTLAPFIRVESNSLINRFIQRSPLAVFDPYTWKVIQAGGPEADIAISKILYGTIALGMAWNAAGKLTGQLSSNPAKKAELEAGNELPQSVHADGRFEQSSNLAMSLFPWDQHNATAQIVKSARDAFESNSATPQQKMVGLKLAFESVLHNIADMSWMASTTPFTDALTSSETQGPTKIARLAGDQAKTFVPNILNQVERMTDNKRDIRPNDPTDISGTIANDVKSAIPGLAQTLPVKYSVYGRPMETGATPEGIHNWVGRGNNLEETSDPTEKELNRLANLTKAAIVTPVQRTIKVAKVPVKLTPEQAEEYQMYAGQTITGSVKAQMDSGTWKQMSDTQKIVAVRAIQKQAKAAIRDALIQKEGWLNDDQVNTIRSQLGGQ